MPDEPSALQFDIGFAIEASLKIAAAFLAALPVGWDRERADRSAGLRTFPLVAMSSCAFLMISKPIFDADAQARIVQGLITGIGFIGGGAILKSGDRVRGTATAASIWTTGAIGVAVAYSRFESAVILSFATFATLRWLHRLDGKNVDPDRGDGSDA
ncbi:MAG: MgtC/SapB family protein [Planctomycetes bacterium]|nr:MgtC/SapB family protein [Planctomycetota bacterium]